MRHSLATAPKASNTKGKSAATTDKPEDSYVFIDHLSYEVCTFVFITWRTLTYFYSAYDLWPENSLSNNFHTPIGPRRISPKPAHRPYSYYANIIRSFRVD